MQESFTLKKSLFFADCSHLGAVGTTKCSEMAKHKIMNGFFGNLYKEKMHGEKIMPSNSKQKD